MSDKKSWAALLIILIVGVFLMHINEPDVLWYFAGGLACGFTLRHIT